MKSGLQVAIIGTFVLTLAAATAVAATETDKTSGSLATETDYAFVPTREGASNSSPPGPNAAPAPSTPASTPIVWREPADAADFNRSIYYRNKLEFSLEGGWLPNNIPFVFDRFIGQYDEVTPLHYTLVPFIGSLRWHMNGIGGRWIFRGNWDATFSGTYTMVARGPESRYLGYLMGIRRNFIQRNWRIVPFFEGRVGMGDVNAKGPYGVDYAQGQDLTFTVMLGGGARYNVSPRFAVSGGVWYMHISNLYMSEPAFQNYGINVYGPMVGLTMQLGRQGHPRIATVPPPTFP